MQAYANRERTADSARASPDSKASIVPAMRAMNPLWPMVALQVQRRCTCGGECPQCNGAPAVQAHSDAEYSDEVLTQNPYGPAVPWAVPAPSPGPSSGVSCKVVSGPSHSPSGRCRLRPQAERSLPCFTSPPPSLTPLPTPRGAVRFASTSCGTRPSDNRTEAHRITGLSRTLQTLSTKTVARETTPATVTGRDPTALRHRAVRMNTGPARSRIRPTEIRTVARMLPAPPQRPPGSSSSTWALTMCVMRTGKSPPPTLPSSLTGEKGRWKGGNVRAADWPRSKQPVDRIGI